MRCYICCCGCYDTVIAPAWATATAITTATATTTASTSASATAGDYFTPMIQLLPLSLLLPVPSLLLLLSTTSNVNIDASAINNSTATVIASVTPNMTEKHLPPLHLTRLASQVAERWLKWKRVFEYYAEGKSIENVLYLYISPKWDCRTYSMTYKTLVLSQSKVKMLTKLLFASRVKENIPYEHHVFCQLSPRDGETAHQFMARLKNKRDTAIFERVWTTNWETSWLRS